MSATNATSNYSLPLFIGTDKPAWLVDFNGAMTAIDAQMKVNATAIGANETAISGLSTTVSAHTTSINTISGQITTLSTGLNTAQGNINTINSLIGNGEPTTTDKTLIGAINEIYGMITGGGSTEIQAANVSYDNTTSGLTASSVQAAIDEVVAALPGAAAVELQRGTLTAGQTSVVLTFSSQTISATSLIDVYVEDGINFTAITTSTSTVTLTFEAQGANKAVAVRVTN